MQPFFFGPAGRRLFGIYHPAVSRGTTAALLLCNPFGQEAVRVHRIYRVLSERVSRMGVAVLRFDYYGTGDSAGSDADGSLDGWIADIHTASDELARRASASHTTWLGARLGATLVAQATTTATYAPDNLTLWEPILDGPAYLQALGEGTVAALELSLGAFASARRAMPRNHSPSLETEAIGFELVDPLLGQVRALSANALLTPRVSNCTVIHEGGASQTEALLRRWRNAGLSVNELILKHEFDWVAEEALNTALVPAEIVQHLVAMVTKR